MRTIHAEPLQEFVEAILEQAGSNSAEAKVVAEHLVLANLLGHDSHGVLRMRDYSQWLREGKVLANQQLSTVFETETLAITRGHLGFGQSVAVDAVEMGINKCRSSGVAIVALREVAHLGRIGHWSELAAAAHVISIHFVSTNGFGVLVAPHGGVERRLSANPFSIGIPRQAAAPLILDMSTCAIAEGKIKVARNSGKPIPTGCVINAAGEPTTDPNEFYQSPPGSILPIAGHKGYGLSLCTELLAGALTGNGCSQHQADRLEQGMLSIYIDPDRFEGQMRFDTEMRQFIEYVKSSPHISPTGEILVPGELEAQTKEERLAKGIPLDDTTWSHLLEEAAAFGLATSRYPA